MSLLISKRSPSPVEKKPSLYISLGNIYVVITVTRNYFVFGSGHTIQTIASAIYIQKMLQASASISCLYWGWDKVYTWYIMAEKMSHDQTNFSCSNRVILRNQLGLVWPSLHIPVTRWFVVFAHFRSRTNFFIFLNQRKCLSTFWWHN